MKKKIIAYFLIVFGALPLLSKIFFTALSSGNQQAADMFPKFGNGFILIIYIIGAILMIMGFYILKKQKFITKSEQLEKNLNIGEKVISKHIGNASILTITNQRILFYGFYIDNLRKSVADLPKSNYEFYPLEEISSVKPINTNDLAQNKQLVSAKWGVQIGLKNGKIVNIPISEQELVAQQIKKLIVPLF